MAEERGLPAPRGVSTGQAMQEALDRAVQMWRFAQDQLNRVTVTTHYDDDGPMEGFFEERKGPGGSTVIVPSRWYTLEVEARRDVEKLAGMMTQLGIAERSVRVDEARAALVIASIKDAAIEAGLDNDQVRALGMALRSRLEEATSTAPAAHDSRASVGITRSQNAVTARKSVR